ncbi:MAG: flagellar motor protein MotB [Nitrospiria bacterium]
MAKEVEEDDADPNAWMATFADLLSLLLTFFVLLFAMKSVDQGKLEESLGYFRMGGIGILNSGTHMPIVPPDPLFLEPALPRMFTMEDIRRLIENHKGLQGKVKVKGEKRGIVISVSSAILFSSGEALLREDAEPVLNEIIPLIKGGDHLIQVEGHTDNQPISTALYPSNWELSVARAGQVVRHLLEKGDIEPKRFSVVGYGDSRPLQSNDTGENRAANRRVELVLLK